MKQATVGHHQREAARTSTLSERLPGMFGGQAAASRRRQLKALLLASAAVIAVAPAAGHAQLTQDALPTGGTVSAGNATVRQSGAQMDIDQASQRAILNWQSFDVGQRAGVNFNQPDAGAVALNRVLSANPSQIHGRLNANGQVFLVNASGIVFGAGAQVNVGGLVASTMNIEDTDFMAGRNIFRREGSTAAVVNHGELTAAPGGFIGLLAPEVRNEGVVSAKLGTVALTGGEQVTLTFADSGNVTVQVEPGAVRTLIENNNLITAPDGRVIMSAKAATVLLGGTINNTGVVEADSLTTHGGVVVLEASGAIAHSGHISASGAIAGGEGDGGSVSLVAGGTTVVSGSIAARGGRDGGDGGKVETSAPSLALAGAHVDTTAPKGQTGTWRIDPFDLTVVADSGDLAPSDGTVTSGPAGTTVTNTVVQDALETTNVTLETGGAAGDGQGNGDIFVNAPIAWETGNALTLTAFRNIDVNADITHGGTDPAHLTMNPGTGGAGGALSVDHGATVTLLPSDRLTIGDHDYTLIDSVEGLDNVRNDLAGRYALISGLAFGPEIAAFDGTVPSGVVPFSPIGDGNTPFGGAFEGLGHSLANLPVVEEGGSQVGLFGANSGEISNLHLTGALVVGSEFVGGLAGINFGTVRNSSVDGQIVGSEGGFAMGVLAGINEGSIKGSYTNGSISSVGGGVGGSIGGLVGWNGTPGADPGQVVKASIEGSSSRVTIGVSPDASTIGGLVGVNFGTVHDSSAEINILPSDTFTGTNIGGLVGYNYQNGVIVRGRADGFVRGWAAVGGLVGWNEGTVRESGAAASVIGDFHVGGLVGLNEIGATVSHSWASGTVRGVNWVGGLVGQNDTNAILHESLALGAVTGMNDVGGFVGRNFGTIRGGVAHGAVSVAIGGAGVAIGGLVGSNTGTIGGSHAEGNVEGRAQVGGLAGSSDGSIDGSYATGSVSLAPGGSTGGGLVGLNSGPISDSYASGDISGRIALGGLVGMNGGTISDSHATGEISGTGPFPQDEQFAVGRFGGLVGQNFGGGAIQRSYAETRIVLGDDHSDVGGLAGHNFGLIKDSHATATIVGGANNSEVGGLVGWNDRSIEGSYSHVTIRLGAGATNIGGLVGENTGTVHDSSAHSNILPSDTLMNSNFGGLVGSNSGVIVRGRADGFVRGSAVMGGLVGSNTGGTIRESGAAVTVVGDVTLGGLVGRNSGTVRHSWASGSIPHGGNVGGLVGENTASGFIFESLALGSITAGHTSVSNAGGFVGVNMGTIHRGDARGAVTSGTGGFNLGGLVGRNEGTIIDSRARGDVTAGADAREVGGLAGHNLGEIDGSSSTSRVRAGDRSTNVGGLVGHNSGHIHDSSAENQVSAGSSSMAIGGLVGFNHGTVDFSFSTGQVRTGDDTNSVGGLVGRNEGAVTRSLAVGPVRGGDRSVNFGGLVGANGTTGEIRDSWSVGPVHVGANSEAIGSLVGKNRGTIIDSIGLGPVRAGRGSINVGGQVGDDVD